jgi:hypothetical protein
MPHSVGNAKSPVRVRVRRHQAVHLEAKGESIAGGYPKHQVASRVAHSNNPRGKEGKGMHLLMFHLLP